MTEITNECRANRASNIILVYNGWRGDFHHTANDLESDAKDLITDLLHMLRLNCNVDDATQFVCLAADTHDAEVAEGAAEAAGWEWHEAESEWRKPSDEAPDGYIYAATAWHALNGNPGLNDTQSDEDECRDELTECGWRKATLKEIGLGFYPFQHEDGEQRDAPTWSALAAMLLAEV